LRRCRTIAVRTARQTCLPLSVPVWVARQLTIDRPPSRTHKANARIKGGDISSVRITRRVFSGRFNFCFVIKVICIRQFCGSFVVRSSPSGDVTRNDEVAICYSARCHVAEYGHCALIVPRRVHSLAATANHPQHSTYASFVVVHVFAELSAAA